MFVLTNIIISMITTLDKLNLNYTAIIYKLNSKGTIRRRFQDLGIIEGAKITPKLSSPSGNLVAYDIKGALIALRTEDSNNIEIKLIV